MKGFSLFLFCALFFYSCIIKEEPKYTEIRIPEMPVNMGDINSVYDDYNSNIPWGGITSPLIFSSNRYTKGKEFDFIYKLLDVDWSYSEGVLSVHENTSTNLDVYSSNYNIMRALEVVNTSYDELGPYFIPKGMIRNSTVNNGRYQSYIFLYANNREGNQDIKFVENFTSPSYSEPRAVTFLNSPQEDAYPCLTKDTASIYFCSNREGDFDIFKVLLNPNMDLITNLLCCNPSFKCIIFDNLFYCFLK